MAARRRRRRRESRPGWRWRCPGPRFEPARRRRAWSRAGDLLDAPVPQTVDQAVRTDEEAVARMMGQRADMGFDELVTGAQGLIERVAPRVGARLPLVDGAVAPEPTDVGMIMGDLVKGAVPRQAVDSAVADMAEMQAGAPEPAQA